VWFSEEVKLLTACGDASDDLPLHYGELMKTFWPKILG
jgi:hypothetical protein